MNLRISFLILALGLTGLPLSAGAREVQIRIEGMKFVPEQAEIHVGDQVVWSNADIVPHTATADGTGKKRAFDSKIIAAGSSFRFTAKKAAKIPYSCALHPTMHGALEIKR